MSEFFNQQQEIIKKIQDVAAKNKFSAYEGAIPTGEHLKQTNGRYWPYVIYGLGGKSEAANRFQGIGSSADDVKWTALVFHCVGESLTTVRRLKEVLRNEFEGYIHAPGWGEFTEVLTGDFGISKPNPDLAPLRFGEPLAFKCLGDF